MKRVFAGLNNVEAHVVAHLLEAEGIKTSLSGEYLSGARGELPAQDQASVWVMDDADEARARELIAQWEQDNPAPAQNAKNGRGAQKAGPNEFLMGGLVGLVVGCLLTYSYFYSPVSRDGVDYNGDGKIDAHLFNARAERHCAPEGIGDVSQYRRSAAGSGV